MPRRTCSGHRFHNHAIWKRAARDLQRYTAHRQKKEHLIIYSNSRNYWASANFNVTHWCLPSGTPVQESISWCPFILLQKSETFNSLQQKTGIRFTSVCSVRQVDITTVWVKCAKTTLAMKGTIVEDRRLILTSGSSLMCTQCTVH